MRKRFLAFALAALLLACALPVTASAAACEITNPYENVDWGTYRPYRAALHVHSVVSDAYVDFNEMIEAHYAAGFDVLAMTDHGTPDLSWTKPNYYPTLQFFQQIDKPSKFFPQTTGLTEERFREITEGTGPEGRKMLRVPYGVELNTTALDKSHVNSWFSDWGGAFVGGTLDYETSVSMVDKHGGLCVINHPSESNGDKDKPFGEAYAGKRYNYVYKLQRLFEKYDALIGIEMPNWQDHLLWDNLLMNLAPQGRNVFGLNTSDTHKISDWMTRGHVWTLMEDNTVDNLRECLGSGAFFAAARYIDSADEMARWNAQLGESWGENSWDADRSNPEPMITSIDAGNGKITLTAVNYRAVQWISDGEVVATGLQIDLAACENLGAYVRAAVLGTGGVLYTQPFLLDYAGKPMGKSVPKNYFDFGQVLAAFRWLLYPIAFVSDKIMRLRYCL